MCERPERCFPAPRSPQPVAKAVLDWELSTLGNPLADLAYLCISYHLPDNLEVLPALPQPLPPGVPSEGQLVAWYCDARGVPRPPEAEWRFFLALALFRVAAILAGVHARALQGNASSARALEVAGAPVVRGIAQRALDIALGGRAVGGGTGGRSASSTAAAADADASGPASTSGAFEPPPRVRDLLVLLRRFMREHIGPAETTLLQHGRSEQRWSVHPLVEDLKAKAKQQGLWYVHVRLARALGERLDDPYTVLRNLFLPADTAELLRPLLSAHVAGSELSLLLGPGLTNLEYAHLAEEVGGEVHSRCWLALALTDAPAPGLASAFRTSSRRWDDRW